jgi:hypothetical protein
MKKLLLVATISVAGLMSASTGNPTFDSSKNTKEEKSQKIEIKESKSTATILLIAGETKCYNYDKNGHLVEVPCPAVIITGG